MIGLKVDQSHTYINMASSYIEIDWLFVQQQQLMAICLDPDRANIAYYDSCQQITNVNCVEMCTLKMD